MALVEDLYKKLTEGGYYTKSLGEFEAQLEDPTYRKKVHGVVTRDGIEDTDFETFDVKYTPLKKKRRIGFTFNGKRNKWFIGYTRNGNARAYGILIYSKRGNNNN